MNITLRIITPLIAFTLLCFLGFYSLSSYAASTLSNWDRQVDWDDGSANTTSQGNPDDDIDGAPAWQYEYFSGGGGLGSALPWYTRTAQLQVWTNSWFNQSRGGWVKSFNEAPLTRNDSLVSVLSKQRHPVVRWLNPANKATLARVSGNLLISWSSAASGNVELALVRDSGDNTFDLLWSETVNYQGGVSVSSSVIDPGIELSDANDTVFFTYRTSGNSGWVTVKDDLQFSLDPYIEGFSWNRNSDWSVGTESGTTAGNPDDDARNRSAWFYAYVNSVEALGSRSPWYTDNINLLVWDSSWYSQPGGAWAVSDNVGPVVMQDKMSLTTNQGRSIIVKWENPTLENLRINITGSLILKWNRTNGGGAEGNIEIAILRQKADGVLEPLFIQTHNLFEGNNKQVDIDLRSLQVARNENILFAYRSNSPRRWVTIEDDITVSIMNQPFQLFVKPDGNNANSGTNVNSALASLEGAKNKIRSLRRTANLSDAKAVEVQFSNGVYPVINTVLFNDELDAGTAENPVIYRATNPGQVFFEGGRNLNSLVSGLSWSQYSGDIYVASVGALKFNSLFVNGKRGVRARTPDNGGFPIIKGMPAPYTDTDLIRAFQFRPGDIDAGWGDLRSAEIVSYHSWIAYRHLIDSVDTTASVVFMQQTKPLVSTRSYNFGVTPQYYVENFLQAINQPGEWYLDKNNGLLYYQKHPAQVISSIEFIVPDVERFFEASVDNIIFQGVHFRYSDWSMPVGGYQQTPSSGFNQDIPRSIVLAGKNLSFLDNSISLTGGWALDVTGDNVRIARNEMRNTGAGGVLIEDVENVGVNAWVFDNTILSPSEVWADAAGLTVKNSKNAHIINNRISCMPYSAIVSQQQGSVTGLAAFNLIQHNNIHDAMRILTDGAGIRMRGSQTGTAVQANHIKNVLRLGGGDTSSIQNQLQMGLYIDDRGEGIAMRENLVVNTGMGFILNNGFSNNLVEHNVFVNARYRAFHLNNDVAALRSNVVAWTQDTGNKIWLVFKKGNSANQVTDSNLFNYSVLANVEYASLLNTGTNALFNVRPQFVSQGQGDFRLQISSPALDSLQIPFNADWLINSDGGGVLLPAVDPLSGPCKL